MASNNPSSGDRYTGNKDTDNDKYDKGRVIWNGHTIKTMRDSTTHGASLKGTNLSLQMSRTKYSIVCGIEITNWTRYHLTEPKCTIDSGYISSPATSIRPGQMEAMVTHKHGYTPTGSSGVVSWLVNKKNQRIVVLWSSPYFRSNAMAVGLTMPGTENHDEQWFWEITKHSRDTKLKYKLLTYDNTSNEINVDDDSFEICGIMGTSSKPEIKITFRPKRLSDLSTVRVT